MGENLILSMKNINKTFSSVKVLNNVYLNVKNGECHAIIGENGAGKSTLMKILTGIYQKDSNSGSITFNGKDISLKNIKEAENFGISMVHQELNMIPNMSVAENILLSHQPKKFCFIDWGRTWEMALDILRNIGIGNIDVKKPLKRFGPGVWQMVSIARAISQKSILIIMDEPTSYLDENEIRLLFKVIENLKKKGVSIIYISHKLDEVFTICDRATVLRDGKNISEYDLNKITKFELVSAMIGESADKIIKEKRKAVSDISYEKLFLAKNISDGKFIKNCSIEINKGEVVGLVGLLGSGRTEFANVLFALESKTSGVIFLEGEKVNFKNPSQAIKNGLAFLTENRNESGIIGGMTLKENMTLSSLESLTRFGFIDSKKEKALVKSYIQRLNIKCKDMNQEIRTLSGGNQQKVILSRWLLKDPKFIILDSPTRGIDIKSKTEIETIIDELSKKGKGILLISSEILEIIRNCNKVRVMANGETLNYISGEDISEETIMSCIAKGYTEEIKGEEIND